MTRNDKIKAMNVALRLQGVTLDSNQVDNVIHVYDSIVANDGKTSLNEMYTDRKEAFRNKVQKELSEIYKKECKNPNEELSALCEKYYITDNRLYRIASMILEETKNLIFEVGLWRLYEYSTGEEFFINYTYNILPAEIIVTEMKIVSYFRKLFINTVYEYLV